MNNKRWCSFCMKLEGKYSCPRCGRFYCSINCYNYKDHLVCTEEFNKKNVEDELRLRYLESKEDNQVKRYTYDVLKRELEKRKDEDSTIDENFDYEKFYEMLRESEGVDELEENNDLQELDDLKKKFSKLHLQKSNELWNELTEDEKKNFESLLKQNQIFNLLPLSSMSPWYLQMKSNVSSSSLIEEINSKEYDEKLNETNDKENENFKPESLKSSKNFKDGLESKRVTFPNDDVEEDENKTRDEFIRELENNLIEQNLKVPKIDIKIAKLSDLTKAKPSSSVKCLIINLLFSYCHICRYFNNDQLQTPKEAYRLLNCLCPLSEKSAFISTREAVQSPAQYLINEKKSKLEYILMLMDDLKFIIESPARIYLNMLCDLIHLTNRFLEQLQKKMKKEPSGSLSANDLANQITSAKLIKRKLNYYLCYLNENRDELINELNAIEIERIYLLNLNRSLDEDKNKKEIKFY